jgi:hypothetical protein
MPESLEMRFYLAGYKGILLSRTLRRIIGRSNCHRAWLEGYMGSFIENDHKTSVCDRHGYLYRKGNDHQSAQPIFFIRFLIKPHHY